MVSLHQAREMASDWGLEFSDAITVSDPGTRVVCNAEGSPSNQYIQAITLHDVQQLERDAAWFLLADLPLLHG